MKVKEWIGILFLVFSTIILSVFIYIYVTFHTPASLPGVSKVIQIPPGTNIKKIAEILSTNGLVKNQNQFIYLVEFKKAENKIKAGEFQLNTNMSLLDIFEVLQAGKSVLHNVTIPEGFTITQIAKRLAKRNLADEDRFLALTHESEFISSLGFDNLKSLEGYLFPDTYYFIKGMKEEDIIGKMVFRLKEVFTPEYVNRAQEIGFSMHEVITLASIVEKEVNADEERPLISAVYHNRLKKNIRLQCDPTVIYGIENFNGDLTKKDLKKRTPYNTYRFGGLPPGPIANPGLDSIEAALYPADVDYCYMVSKNDGTHKFSVSLNEHNRAVYKYQKSLLKVNDG